MCTIITITITSSSSHRHHHHHHHHHHHRRRHLAFMYAHLLAGGAVVRCLPPLITHHLSPAISHLLGQSTPCGTAGRALACHALTCHACPDVHAALCVSRSAVSWAHHMHGPSPSRPAGRCSRAPEAHHLPPNLPPPLLRALTSACSRRGAAAAGPASPPPPAHK